MQRFDPQIVGFMEGEVTHVSLTEPGSFPPPGVGNLVVDPTKQFRLHVEWEVYGFLVPLWLAALGGSWDVTVYAESIGGGPERRIGNTTVSVTSSQPATTHAGEPNARRFVADITVPAGVLTENIPGANQSGVYKLVTTTFLNSTLLGVPGFDVVGFEEGPIIMVENPS